MELKDYLKEAIDGSSDVLSTLGNQIKELQLNQFIVGYHNLKNTLSKIYSSNELPDLLVNIQVSENQYNKHFLTAEAFLEKNRSNLATTQPNNFRELYNQVMDIENSIIRALEWISTPSTDTSWLGEISSNKLTIDFSKPDCFEVDDWFLSPDVKVRYENAKLDLSLPLDGSHKPKKMKV